MNFGGFSKEGLEFLTELGTKDKAFLDANRKKYEAEVAAPAKAFVEEMGEALGEAISPQITAIPKTNGSISPINNDVRFSKDAPPYKDHLLFRFWEGHDKKAAPTLFVRLSQESVGFASGMHIKSLDRWRELVADRRDSRCREGTEAGYRRSRPQTCSQPVSRGSSTSRAPEAQGATSAVARTPPRRSSTNPASLAGVSTGSSW